MAGLTRLVWDLIEGKGIDPTRVASWDHRKLGGTY